MELEELKFKEIYLSYFSKMKYFALAYSVSEEDAENIVQDVFMEFWENRAVLINYTNLIAFLFTAVKNQTLNCLRHKIIEQQAVEHLQEEYFLTLRMHLDSLEAFDQSVFSDRELKQVIDRAINSLSDRCRQIFIMSKIDGKKQKQIAEELHISINTVETQMGIAYKKLKTELKNYIPIYLFLVFL
jgi:RNA polymerase sigma-70 factor (ECF subfamily)